MGKDYVDAIDIEVSDPALLKEAEGAISKIIINRHNLKVDDKDSFEILSLKDVLETMESTAKTMRWLLGSIAAISLLVGGIGIMNIMLVSVTERTREIGLRKAIGAKRLDIISQFLIESVVMSLIGGFLGIIFGAGFAMIIAIVSDLPRNIPPYSLLLATVFSIMVGISFGIGPAFKASRLDPIEAIRYE
jgi:macrolide transport system ATP-binding/permease protein